MLVVWRLASAALGLAVAALVQAQGPDELWNMSTRMEMDGMQMPAMSQQVCQKKGQPGAAPAPDPNCTTSDVRTVGNKTTWKMACTGDEPMSGAGEITRTRDSMSGRMQLRGKDGLTMNVVYSGTLAGTCNAQTHQDPQQAAMKQKMAAMQAQSNAQLAQTCRESIEKFATTLFEMQGNPCAASTGEYCAHVKKTAQSMRTPAGYRQAMQVEGLRNDGFERAAQFCKVDPAPVRAAACKSAVGGRDWPFVTEYCPAESQTLAKQHCAGREYTVVMKTEYGPLCSKHSNLLAKGPCGGGRSYTVVKAGGGWDTKCGERPAQVAAPPAAPSAGDAVKEGVRGLRKLFGN